jgi:hypothetical protein
MSMKQTLRQSPRLKFIALVTGCSILIILITIIWLSLNNAEKAEASTNETVSAGSYIINMGITPQTASNGLKPYGLVYDLVVNYNVPVKWVINTAKSKDGTDFTYLGNNYKGGPFIIPAEFINAAVASAISSWNLKGVQGIYTASAITVPVHETITSFPKVMIDTLSSMQSIVKAYYDSAGIPSSAYTLGTPLGLTTCFDLWTNPHGDPSWDSHYPLYNFVTVQKSFIWAECHSVSQMEGCKNSVSPFQQLNFLSTAGLQCWKDNNCGAVTTHVKFATSPFTYQYPTDPIMQFMGNMHEATKSGSEQWYIPDGTGQWQSNVKRCVTTSTGTTPREGAAMVYGPAYGNSSNGWVMYEGGHDLGTTGSSATDRIAAVRAYFNYVLFTGIMRHVNVNFSLAASIQPGSTGVATATVSSGTAPYTYQWSSTMGGTFSNSQSATTVYTAPNLPNGTIDIIKLVVTDQCGRKNFIYQSVTLSSSSLPVELISFNGKRNNNDVQLSWSTASEKDNDYFAIERSQTGTGFTRIAQIEGAGNSSSTHNYKYMDYEAPHCKLYYRLKQVDQNGGETTFNTIAIQALSSNLVINQIFPNPFTDEFNITMQSPFSGQLLIRLYNVEGRMVKEITYDAEPGSNVVNFIAPDNLAAGIYIIRIIQNGQVLASQKISRRN